MLWKLLKYDFRAMGKQFSLIWLAALAVALINRFALPWREDSSSMSAQADSLLALITAMAFVALLVAMVYLSMALGHLFRHRVLMSVVAFFALDIGGTVVIDLADTLGIPLLVKGEHLALWSGTLLMCLTAAAMLAVTSLLLRQRLNLE